MDKIKVYRFGSCRTNYVHNNNNGNYYTGFKQFFNHTPYEVLQILNFFDNKQKLSDSLFPKAFNKFNFEEEKRRFAQSDVVLIEISSLKHIFDDNNISYNMVDLDIEYHEEYGNHWTWINKELNNNIMEMSELVNLLTEIKKRINKPIIFQGHINLDFFDKSTNTYKEIESRQIIDDAIKQVTDNYIIYNDIFDQNEIQLICHFDENVANASKGQFEIVNGDQDNHLLLISKNRTVINIYKDKPYKIKYINQNDLECKTISTDVFIVSNIYDEAPVIFKSNKKFTNDEINELKNADIINIIENHIQLNIDNNHITGYAYNKLFEKFDDIVKTILLNK
jgi:hypothetical protein